MKKSSYTKSLLVLAIPAIIESLLQSMVGFVDTLFISKLGLREVAAVGVSNTILQIYFAVFLALGTASTVFVSRYYGANQKEKVKTVASQSIILTLIIGGIFGIISFFFSEQLLKVMGADRDVLEIGSTYFRIVATPSILISMIYTIGAILRGTGDTKTPLRVGIQMNIVHIVLDYILIFGVFFEGFGVQGAAVASVLARLFAVILLLRHLLSKELISNKLNEWKMKINVIIEQATPPQLIEGVQRFRATTVVTSPTAYRAMLKQVGEFDLSSLRTCVSAGETLPAATFDAWHVATGLRLMDGIGSTEMLHIFVGSPAADVKSGSTGRVVPGYRAKVIDDHGQEVPRGIE